MQTPLGELLMESDGEALTALRFNNVRAGRVPARNQRHTLSNVGATLVVARNFSLFTFHSSLNWLDQYFSGKIPDFTPHIHLEGTPFQKEVWEILLTIPYGQTVTYKHIAQLIAKRRGLPPNKMSAQAVGGAVGRNPIPIIVPCHRVIGTDGTLTGYAGGLWRKQWLLEHECSSYTQKLLLE